MHPQTTRYDQVLSRLGDFMILNTLLPYKSLLFLALYHKHYKATEVDKRETTRQVGKNLLIFPELVLRTRSRLVEVAGKWLSVTPRIVRETGVQNSRLLAP